MPKLLGITQSKFDPASRFRFIQFIPYLQEAGWQVEHCPNRPDRQWSSHLQPRVARAIHYRAGRTLMKVNRVRDLVGSRGFDAAFINRDLAAEGPLLQKLFLPLVRRAVFDFDDAIFVGKREPLVREMCRNAFWVTAGNRYLADYSAQFTDRITIVPTVIDTDSYVPRDFRSAATGARVRIGWSGSDQSIGTTLMPHLPMLEALQQETSFELVIITNTEPKLPTTSLRWKFVQWKADDEAILAQKFDIGIMPLVDDAFQKGKCALKLLQYMAAGLPTVASPVGVNQEVLLQGSTGFFARTDAEWHQALRCLLSNHELRASMGQEGRKRCESNYSVRRWLPVLTNLFDQISARKHQLADRQR